MLTRRCAILWDVRHRGAAAHACIGDVRVTPRYTSLSRGILRGCIEQGSTVFLNP